MNAATANFTSEAVIAAALQTQLQQVQLPPNSPGNATPAPCPAFLRVEMFDLELWLEAFMQRGISEQRIAIIVPGDPEWQIETRGRRLLERRVVPYYLFLSDRVLGDRVAALYGNATTPGAFGLQALALPFLAGQLISNPNGVVSLVKSSAILHLKPADRQSLPGRGGVVVYLDCRGGTIEAPLDAGPTL